LNTVRFSIHPHPDALEHHIATVESYINAIDSRDTIVQGTLFHKFTRYILASCWRKMCLSVLIRFPGQNARATDFQSGLDKSDYAQELRPSDDDVKGSQRVSIEYRTPNGQVREPPDILVFGEHVGDDRQLHIQCGYLLRVPRAACCHAFGLCLQAFAMVMRKPDQFTEKRRVNLAIEFHRFSRLLWRVTYSRMLTQHLAMLEAGSLLYLPSEHFRLC
jgi:hypothetical protein